MSTIDQQFIEYIVKSLVSNPDDVEVERTIDEKGVLLKLTVNQEDLGRVIGKRGSTAQSIRTLLRALGTKNDARYNLKIVDVGDGAPAPAPASKPAKEEESAAESEAPSSVAETEAPKEEPALAAAPVEEDEEKNSLADKTRKELAELDDLDI